MTDDDLQKKYDRLLEINASHCKTVNLYILDNSKKEDEIKRLKEKVALQEIALNDMCESLNQERGCNDEFPADNMGNKKLTYLLTQGWSIDGYCIHKNHERYGFVTYGGMVGWWLPEYYENHTSDEYYVIMKRKFNGDFSHDFPFAVRTTHQHAMEVIQEIQENEDELKSEYYITGPFTQ
jgi:hypothetical protein